MTRQHQMPNPAVVSSIQLLGKGRSPLNLEEKEVAHDSSGAFVHEVRAVTNDFVVMFQIPVNEVKQI